MSSFSQSDVTSKHRNGADLASFATRTSDMAHNAEERIGDVRAIIETVVTNRPVLALGAALAAGVFLGWLIKRR